MELTIIFLWFFFMWVVGYMASTRKRSVFGWLLFALFLSPLLGWIALLVVGDHPLHGGHTNAEKN